MIVQAVMTIIYKKASLKVHRLSRFAKLTRRELVTFFCHLIVLLIFLFGVLSLFLVLLRPVA
jgi:hypothetical protein